MRDIFAVVAAFVLALHTASAAETVGGEKAFSFVALGDMPYDVPGDYAKFDRLIATINKLKPAFSIHVGDIKSGGGACTDEAFAKVYEQFQRFEQPLIYAIGDNEWTDCHRYRKRRTPDDPPGIDDPLDRLAKLRALFFASPGQSLGKTTMPVESQGKAMPAYGEYVENVRFEKNGVLFVSLHITGSNNGLQTPDQSSKAEYVKRNRANLTWIATSFRRAHELSAKAVVLAFQANLHDIRDKNSNVPPESGFFDTINAIEKHAKAFDRPVLIVHGDAHELEATGFRKATVKPKEEEKLVPKVIRLQVMGAKKLHAVRVIVDPDSPGVFGFMPLIVPENGTF